MMSETNEASVQSVVRRSIMKTVTIQIGNSDNKLGQKAWSEFIRETRQVVGRHCGQVHFDGGSNFDSPWQNVCIVAEVQAIDKQALCDALGDVRSKFYQDSAAVTFGQTKLV
jgi:hypothetical protein